MMYPEHMVGARLKELGRAAGYPDLAKFARAAGIEPDAARKQAKRNSIPSDIAPLYIQAARATGADLDWLLTGAGTPPRPLPALPKRIPNVRKRTIDVVTEMPQVAFIGEEISRIPNQGYVPGVPLPVRETLGLPGGGGHFMLTERVIDEVPRPGFLSPKTEAFSFYLEADDMDPRYERGDRLLANPSLPLVEDKDFLFLGERDASGRQKGLVRRLLSFTDDHWRVKCHNPSRVHNLARSEWPNWIRIEAGRGR